MLFAPGTPLIQGIPKEVGKPMRRQQSRARAADKCRQRRAGKIEGIYEYSGGWGNCRNEIQVLVVWWRLENTREIR